MVSQKITRIKSVFQVVIVIAVILPALSSLTFAQQPLTSEQAAVALKLLGFQHKGFVILSPEEARLQYAIEQIPKLERDYRNAQEKLVTARQQLARQRAIYQQAIIKEKELKEELLKKDLTDKKKRQLKAEQEQVTAFLSQLNEQSSKDFLETDLVALATHIRQLSQLTSQLLLATLAVDEITDEKIAASYENARENPRVLELIELQGPRYKLGPYRNSYRNHRQRIEKAKQLVSNNWLPVYRNEHHEWLSVIVNENAAMSFQYRPDRTISLVPQRVLVNLGIPIKADAPTILLTSGDQSFKGYKITLSRLRLGTVVLENIDIIVLPDEDSNTPAQLGANVFHQLQTQLKEDEFKMVFSKRTDESNQANPSDGK